MAPADSVSNEALFPRWWSFHHNHMEEGNRLLWSFFCKSMKSTQGAPPSRANHLLVPSAGAKSLESDSLQRYGL